MQFGLLSNLGQYLLYPIASQDIFLALVDDGRLLLVLLSVPPAVPQDIDDTFRIDCRAEPDIITLGVSATIWPRSPEDLVGNRAGFMVLFWIVEQSGGRVQEKNSVSVTRLALGRGVLHKVGYLGLRDSDEFRLFR